LFCTGVKLGLSLCAQIEDLQEDRENCINLYFIYC